jgi:hypothetical protein
MAKEHARNLSSFYSYVDNFICKCCNLPQLPRERLARMLLLALISPLMVGTNPFGAGIYQWTPLK